MLPAFIRWLHIIAAAFWIGGILFVVIVLTPLARKEFPPEERLRIVSAIGRRFNTYSWAALALLVATGLYNTYWRLGGLSLEPLLGSAYGRLLLIKVAIVLLVVALTWLHSYVLAPKLERLASEPSTPGAETLKAQRLLIRVSSVHLLLNLAVVFLAAVLALS